VHRPATLALILVLAAAGCGGEDEKQKAPATGGAGQSSTAQPEPEVLLPGGGQVPEARVTRLVAAARAAECRLSSTTARSRDHTADIAEKVDYDTNPPTTGEHFQVAAQDGIYEEAPPDTTVVHSQEHGRVVIWFRPSLPREARAGLRALVEEDGYQILLVPRSEMPFEVAATAWNRSPGPEGTGRLLGCPSFSPETYDALRAFRDQNRGRGPESVP
jgi:Protein of unknown function (DUF3105)